LPKKSLREKCMQGDDKSKLDIYAEIAQ